MHRVQCPCARVSGDLSSWREGTEAHLCPCNSGSGSAVSEQPLEKKCVKKTKCTLDICRLLTSSSHLNNGKE